MKVGDMICVRDKTLSQSRRDGFWAAAAVTKLKVAARLLTLRG